MARKKFLTVEDLYNYYSSTSKRSRHFSAKDEDASIVVQMNGNVKFEADNTGQSDLTPVSLQACHTKINRNGFNINDDVMQAALPSFVNKPILGYIHEVGGQPEFYSHNAHEENGETIYDEIPIGIIPESCNGRLEYDEEKKKTYVNVDGYIFNIYTKAAEILQREQECRVSVEIEIYEMSYDAKQGVLDIESFAFNGVTILGVDPMGAEIEEGMLGSNIKLADFTAKNNRVFSQESIITMLEELNSKIDNLSTSVINSKNSKKGGDQMNKLAELMAKYNVTAEQVTFETSNLSDEELEAKFAEVFGDEGEEPAEPENEAAAEGGEAEPAEGQSTEGQTEQAAEEPNFAVVEGADNQMSIVPTTNEKFQKIFEISHEDIRVALYNLLAPVEEADNEWYFITETHDDYFIYEGYFNEKQIFKQGYTKSGDNVSFNGDRVHMNKEYLTDAELSTLNLMRSTYEANKEKLAKYETEPEKLAILDSADYALIAETEEFKDFKKQESHFDLSVEEVKAKADAMLTDFAKKNSQMFAANTAAPIESKPIISVIPGNGKTGKYGGVFAKRRRDNA